jgi:hypothetical protein
MIVVIEGSDLPGLRRRPDPNGRGHENVHVGLCKQGWRELPVVEGRPWGVTDLVAGNARAARWQFEVVVRKGVGGIDFAGPFVRGKRGDRHTGLAWGELPGDDTFRLFRGAKLRLDAIDPDVIRDAATPGRCLVGRLALTDAKGNPRCASVRPPDIVWSVESA